MNAAARVLTKATYSIGAFVMRHQFILSISIVITIGLAFCIAGCAARSPHVTDNTLAIEFELDVWDVDPLTGKVRRYSGNKLAQVIDEEIAFLISDAFLEKVLNHPEVKASSWYRAHEGGVDALILDLQEIFISVQPSPKRRAIRVQAVMVDSSGSRALLNAIRESYLKHHQPVRNVKWGGDIRNAQRDLSAAIDKIAVLNRKFVQLLKEHPRETHQAGSIEDQAFHRLVDEIYAAQNNHSVIEFAMVEEFFSDFAGPRVTVTAGSIVTID